MIHKRHNKPPPADSPASSLKYQTPTMATTNRTSRNSKRVQRSRRFSLSLAQVKRIKRALEQHPKAIELLDSLSFFSGVILLIFLEFMFLVFPSMYHLVYVGLFFPLLAIRYYCYRKCKYHGFCLDFCYFSNLLTIAQILFFRKNAALFQVCFSFATGPLTLAINVWRNSLVFHSLDNLTSLLLHIQPSLVMYCLRWRLENGLPASFSNSAYLNAFIVYLAWQMLYLLVTEFLSTPVKNDQKVMTSLRWMRIKSTPGSWTYKAFQLVPEKLHWLAFALIQIGYTFSTMIHVRLVYEKQWLHVCVIIVSLITCVYNGSKVYMKKYVKLRKVEMNGE
ncbi:hypothetical protein P9112_011583 [Eukaryota sp. TZLM1-RC]